jgi:hypothetical protein
VHQWFKRRSTRGKEPCDKEMMITATITITTIVVG